MRTFSDGADLDEAGDRAGLVDQSHVGEDPAVAIDLKRQRRGPLLISARLISGILTSR